MRRLIIVGALTAMFCAPGFAATLKPGQPLPHFSVTTLDGRNIDSNALLGKVTIVHFWATWCPPCREEMPALEKFYQAHHDEGLEVIAVSVEDDADKAKVLEFTRNFSFPVTMQGPSRMEGFGRIWGLPLSFLFDRKGILRKGDWTGEQKMDASNLDAFVGPLLKEH